MAAVSTEVKAWCIQELLRITDAEDDVTGKILSINTASELECYLKSFLDPQDSEHRKMLTELSNVLETCDVDFSYSKSVLVNLVVSRIPLLKRVKAKRLCTQEKNQRKTRTICATVRGGRSSTKLGALAGKAPL